MTHVLVALMIINGQLQEHMSVQPGRTECETAARAARALYPDAMAICLTVPGALT